MMIEHVSCCYPLLLSPAAIPFTRKLLCGNDKGLIASLKIIKETTMTRGWKVYLVKCADNSLYCGSTNDVNTRIEKHNSGKGAKYTQSRLPVELVAVSRELSKSDALRLEHYIKQQPAGKKIGVLKQSQHKAGQKAH